ncbi:MAG: J domain-containing protein [Bacteroidaceae bacterium]|nr:J domain-containing protein [Bacteroidaceae bacterium]
MSYKWIFGFIGMYFSGGKGFLFGFLLGWLIDSMFGRSSVRFTFRRTAADDFADSQQQQQQTWHPYVDVTLQEAYRTLGIPSTATDEQVRQAYRQLALRYHPDRVASQGEAARQAAEENFQRITEARDIIMRARGVQ